ncbi:hypothetical protein NCCP1664_17560 [Zafaria cholistanensis]|uniref:Uncharacterized protein n=1 Tax=Zafaria cholistanensis TaxID=1682741 RepID=A0A5A7NR33_9MICC|nr:hypothetical protein [Zafaria cholistanensis]GER23260.1 hypothetical protein NCCP1664_17560 [Zafaria cholistanensis]
MSGKLDVKVALNLEGESAVIIVRGSVDAGNVQALYSLARRANSMGPGFGITVDLSAATVEQEVLDALQAYASLRRLPKYIDPEQAECILRIVPGEPANHTRQDMTLAV